MKFIPMIYYILLARSSAVAAARNPLQHGGAVDKEKNSGINAGVAKLGPAIHGTAVAKPVTSRTNDGVINPVNVGGTADAVVANFATNGTINERGLSTVGIVDVNLLVSKKTSNHFQAGMAWQN